MSTVLDANHDPPGPGLVVVASSSSASYSAAAAADLLSRKRRSSTVTDADKTYTCTHPGCGKSFMRSDHLSRHKLNHQANHVFQCDRCPRTFVRPDLLKRHAERHDKREQSGLQSQPRPGRIKGSIAKNTKKNREAAALAAAAAAAGATGAASNAEGSTGGAGIPVSPPQAGNSNLSSASGHGLGHSRASSSVTSGTPSLGPQLGSAPGHYGASISTSGSFPHLQDLLSPTTLEGAGNGCAGSSAPGSGASVSLPLPSPPVLDNYDHDRFTDLLAPQPQRSPSPQSSANLLLDFSHLTDQMGFSSLQERSNSLNLGGIGAGAGARNSNSNSILSSSVPSSSSAGADLLASFLAQSAAAHRAQQAQSQPHIPQAPPAPPIPPSSLDVSSNRNSQHSQQQQQQQQHMSTSNFNAAFDFGTTYAVASSNYAEPFLSAQEANWLFNQGDLQLDDSAGAQGSSSAPSTSIGARPAYMRSLSSGTSVSISSAASGQGQGQVHGHGHRQGYYIPTPPPPPPLPLPSIAQTMREQHPLEASQANVRSRAFQPQSTLNMNTNMNMNLSLPPLVLAAPDMPSRRTSVGHSHSHTHSHSLSGSGSGSFSAPSMSPQGSNFPFGIQQQQQQLPGASSLDMSSSNSSGSGSFGGTNAIQGGGGGVGHNYNTSRKGLHVHFADATPSSSSVSAANFGQNMDHHQQQQSQARSASPAHRDSLSGRSNLSSSLPTRSASAPLSSFGNQQHQQQQSQIFFSDITAAAAAAQPAQQTMSSQGPAPRIISVGLSARNRLAKHLSAIPNLLSDSRFSASGIDDYIARFFEWDSYHYSVIHRATFEPDEASNHLLSAMLAIGAYYTNTEAHSLAEEIHRCNLQSLMSSSSFCARADMQTIQASLCINVFGRMMSNYEDHEKAHILYPSFLTMYRRSALFNTRNSPVEPGADIHSRWIAWREDESSKRAAFMAYHFDVVCNTMFRQTGTLSAFQIQLTLPCFEDEWYAPSAIEWHKMHQHRAEPPPFLTTVKAFLMPGLNAPEISPLARVCCLSGLLSVAFDMQWREYFLLGLSTHPDGLVKDWRPTMTSALNCWKARFDTALTASPTAYGTQLLRNSIPIYAIAHVTLAVDVDELQIFAGKRRALGLPVPASVVDTTRRRIIQWASVRGKEAVWHAAHFLRSSLLTRRPYQDNKVHPMCLSWCLYLSCLCVHAYSTAASLSGGMPENDEAMHVDALGYLDVICASSPDAINLANNGSATGVCQAISRVLKEDRNWELAQEAGQLLDKVAEEGK